MKRAIVHERFITTTCSLYTVPTKKPSKLFCHNSVKFPHTSTIVGTKMAKTIELC